MYSLCCFFFVSPSKCWMVFFHTRFCFSSFSSLNFPVKMDFSLSLFFFFAETKFHYFLIFNITQFVTQNTRINIHLNTSTHTHHRSHRDSTKICEVFLSPILAFRWMIEMATQLLTSNFTTQNPTKKTTTLKINSRKFRSENCCWKAQKICQHSYSRTRTLQTENGKHWK